MKIPFLGRAGLVALFWFATRCGGAGPVATTAPSEPAAPLMAAQVAITPAADTTHALGPVLSDGRIDYVEAIHQHCMQGVTPENNAILPFARAVGPAAWEGFSGPEWERIGGKPLPESSPGYFIPWERFIEGTKLEVEPAAADLPTKLARSAWSAEQYPEAAKWLKANDGALAMVVEAASKPRLALPVVRKPGQAFLQSIHGPYTSQRQVSVALAARSLLRLSAGDADGFTNDLASAHRLANLMRQQPVFVAQLVAEGTDEVVANAVCAAAAMGKLTAAQANATHRGLAAGEPLRCYAAAFDIGERYVALDSLQIVAATPGASQQFDWNAGMRRMNAWYDRLSAAMALPTLARRRTEIMAAGKDFERAIDEKQRSTPYLMRADERIMVMLSPISNITYVGISERASARTSLVRIVLALAAFKTDHGAFPGHLSDLAPTYLDAIPTDWFADGQEPKYVPTDSGFKLYSVGWNGKDEGGNRDWKTRADDLLLRVPPEGDAAR